MESRFDEFFEGGFIAGTISGARKGETPEHSAKKVTLRAFERHGEQFIQFTFLLNDRALHENRSPREAGARVEELLYGGFSQAALFSRECDLHATCFGKPPHIKLRRMPPSKADASRAAESAHDRDKGGIFRDGEPCAFLEGLGVMNAAGKVFASKHDKLRQINKYLELAEEPLRYAADARPDRSAPLRIVDFGCGKAYLTFAMHWYCTERLGISCETLGVDLKADAEPRRVDMVITLHACDTATDLALAYAVKNGANAVVSVPCCQHELFRQLKSETQSPLMRGILRERIAALVTDAGRAQLMEAFGYRTEAVEFVDAEHTPKNIMLRCTRRAGGMRNQAALERWRAFADSWGIDPTLARLLGV